MGQSLLGNQVFYDHDSKSILHKSTNQQWALSDFQTITGAQCRSRNGNLLKIYNRWYILKFINIQIQWHGYWFSKTDNMICDEH